MCGIFCSLSARAPVQPSPEIERLLMNRGPDSCRICSAEATRDGTSDVPTEHVCIIFTSTVLHLRGDTTIEQPYQRGDNATLCWNGEAWSIDGTSPTGNDTDAVHKLLTEKSKGTLEGRPRYSQLRSGTRWITRILARVAGPYAFVFYNAANGMLFFGRDFLGRRSLLWRLTEEGDLLISSVTDTSAGGGHWSEVEADGIYCVDTRRRTIDTKPDEDVIRWGDWVVKRMPYYLMTRGSADSVGWDHMRVLCLSNLLRQSLSLRILNIPAPPNLEIGDQDSTVCRLAILFSGGLDCTVLARLAHDILPANASIDLLNVAFQNPRIHKASGLDDDNGPSAYELCPDRITGRASYAELQRICPNRVWRFVAANVPYNETLEHRQRVITLMHPHNTEMDLSISYALYFASRGQGIISPSPDVQIPYTTTARVLLSGLGADELFGGYQRHATSFHRNGVEALLDELDLDVGRLGKRNLGRDDRVISNWGREARYPYLDERLLAWAMAASVTAKCGFGEPEPADSEAGDGSELLEPGKKVLRCLAWRLGMRDAAKERKRAIQFGARTAKMETGKTKGTQLLT